MQKTIRIYCSSWDQPTGPVINTCRALLLGLMLSGCGGGGDSSHKSASAPDTMASSVQRNSSGPNRRTAQVPPPAIGKPALSATAAKSVAVSRDEPARLAQLKALPLLSPLADRERAGLLKQLPSASSSERLTMINRYQELSVLPDRQKQVLLDQIEKIVPITIPANQLVCNCSDNIQRKLCVKERCSNRSALQSICNEACGTLASFKSQCQTSQQCASE